MKTKVVHYRRIQGTWFLREIEPFATVEDAIAFIESKDSDDDNRYIRIAEDDTAPRQLSGGFNFVPQLWPADMGECWFA